MISYKLRNKNLNTEIQDIHPLITLVSLDGAVHCADVVMLRCWRVRHLLVSGVGILFWKSQS